MAKRSCAPVTFYSLAEEYLTDSGGRQQTGVEARAVDGSGGLAADTNGVAVQATEQP
ncbi:hypothetical protein [Streptomyces antibioticus]|uniref:hypothetical protein n=1 Tax=Streptomyces antibioticus TaxID=1890 RepID=UPI0036C10240